MVTKSNHITVGALVKVEGWEEVINKLANEDFTKKPYVSMRVSEAGELFYELISKRAFDKKQFGWTYLLVEGILLEAFKHVAQNNAAVYELKDGQSVVLHRLSYFKHYNSIGALKYKFSFKSTATTRACFEWRILADEEEGIMADNGIVCVTKKGNYNNEK